MKKYLIQDQLGTVFSRQEFLEYQAENFLALHPHAHICRKEKKGNYCHNSNTL